MLRFYSIIIIIEDTYLNKGTHDNLRYNHLATVPAYQ